MQYPLHRILTWWLAIGCFGISFIPNAWADTIWIEAATAIYLETQNHAGGRLKATLVDNLNHPISEQPLQISLHSLQSSQKFDRIVQTNARGEIQVALELPVGIWEGTIQFEGNDIYQASHASVTLNVQKCRHEISMTLEIPESQVPEIPHDSAHLFDLFQSEREQTASQMTSELWPLEEPLKLTLKRQPGVCREFEVHIQITAAHESQTIVLAPNVLSVSVPLETANLMPGAYVLNAQLAQNAFYEAESESLNVYLYRDLFEPHIDVTSDWRGTYLLATLNPELSHFSFPLQLTLNDGDKTHAFQTMPSGEGIAIFGPLQGISGCYTSFLTRADKWSESGKYAFQWCFPETETNKGERLVLYAGMIGLASIGMGIGVIRRRRRVHRLPMSPKKLAHSGKSRLSKVEAWPECIPQSDASLASQDPIELICVDAKTGKWIQDATCTEFEQVQWPLKVKEGTHLQIIHPDYMPWQGKLKHKGQYTVKLTAKRDYMISCFESVCSVFYGESVAWGEVSPQKLMNDIRKEAIKPELMQKYERFCQIIAQATFDTQTIDNEKTDEIYQLSVVCKLKQKKKIAHYRS